MYSILSIDGGGILGLIPALFLEQLEAQAKKPCCEIFDLIAGTSTGGILACALAKGLPAKDLVTLYTERGPSIFSRDIGKQLRSLWGLAGSKFDNTVLKAELGKTFGATLLSQVQTPVLVPTYDIAARNVRFFKSWKASKEHCRDYALKDVALATSSAPTYFPPAEIVDCNGGTHYFIDGGMFANNPAICALIEGVKAGHEIGAMQLCSLGTGNGLKPITAHKAAGWGLIRWARPVMQTFMDGQSDSANYHTKYLLGAASCHRLDPISEPQDTMDNANPDHLQDLTKRTMDWIAGPAPQAVLKQVQSWSNSSKSFP